MKKFVLLGMMYVLTFVATHSALANPDLILP